MLVKNREMSGDLIIKQYFVFLQAKSCSHSLLWKIHAAISAKSWATTSANSSTRIAIHAVCILNNF
jgi:hypothetical protein